MSMTITSSGHTEITISDTVVTITTPDTKISYTINTSTTISSVLSETSSPLKNEEEPEKKLTITTRRRRLPIIIDEDPDMTVNTQIAQDDNTTITNEIGSVECDDDGASFFSVATEPMSYTSEQVKMMDDYELLANFMRITGCTELSCTHCVKGKGGNKSLITHWMKSIRARYSKKWKGIDGLCKEKELPKTCDEQQSRNHVSNPVNNPAYSKLRSVRTSEVEKKDIITSRKEMLEVIGIRTRPYRFKED